MASVHSYKNQPKVAACMSYNTTHAVVKDDFYDKINAQLTGVILDLPRRTRIFFCRSLAASYQKTHQYCKYIIVDQHRQLMKVGCISESPM